jgi:hypothetical protein
MAMMAPVGTAPLQNLIMTLHATISKGTKAASKTKKFHPAANYKSVRLLDDGTGYDLTPKASSTKRPANRIKGEDIGRYVTISAIPSLVISLSPACLALETRITTRNSKEWALVLSHSGRFGHQGQEVSLRVTARITVHPIGIRF